MYNYTHELLEFTYKNNYVHDTDRVIGIIIDTDGLQAEKEVLTNWCIPAK